MTHKRIYFRAFSFLLSILLVCTAFVSSVSASAGTVEETENNNIYSRADITYDDYDTYGALPTDDVVDWWKIIITAEGIANFYLGNIPSGCDYDLQLYDYTGTKLLAESVKSSNSAELIKCHVRTGETYYIRVYRASYPGTLSSANYQLRIKRYDLRPGNVYTGNSNEFNSRPVASAVLPKVYSMGFGGQEYLNNVASSVYSAFPDADIFIASNAGTSGEIFLYNSSMFAERRYWTHIEVALSDYSANALSNVKLAVFASNQSGIYDTDFGSLVDETLSKGAFNAIGWTDSSLTPTQYSEWLQLFMEKCAEGKNLGNALTLTNDSLIDEYMQEHGCTESYARANLPSVNSVYSGSSRLYATVLG